MSRVLAKLRVVGKQRVNRARRSPPGFHGPGSHVPRDTRTRGQRRGDACASRRGDGDAPRVEVVASAGSIELALWASSLPPGPAFISRAHEADERAPVVVVATRRAPSGQLVPGFALVDRSCLGVKDWTVYEPMTLPELEALVAIHPALVQTGARIAPMELVQALVFGALDDARALGFEPAEGFPEAFFGPRPAGPSATRGSHTRPLLVAASNDEEAKLRKILDRSVGPGAYDVLRAAPGALGVLALATHSQVAAAVLELVGG